MSSKRNSNKKRKNNSEDDNQNEKQKPLIDDTFFYSQEHVWALLYTLINNIKQDLNKVSNLDALLEFKNLLLCPFSKDPARKKARNALVMKKIDELVAKYNIPSSVYFSNYLHQIDSLRENYIKYVEENEEKYRDAYESLKTLVDMRDWFIDYSMGITYLERERIDRLKTICQFVVEHNLPTKFLFGDLFSFSNTNRSSKRKRKSTSSSNDINNNNSNNPNKKKPRLFTSSSEKRNRPQSILKKSDKKGTGRKISFPNENSQLKEIYEITNENGLDRLSRQSERRRSGQLDDGESKNDLFDENNVDPRINKQMNDSIVILFPEWFDQLFLQPEDVFEWTRGTNSNKKAKLGFLNLTLSGQYYFQYNIQNAKWFVSWFNYSTKSFETPTSMEKSQALKVAKDILIKLYHKSYLEKKSKLQVEFHIDAKPKLSPANQSEMWDYSLDFEKIFGHIDYGSYELKRPMSSNQNYSFSYFKPFYLQFAVPHGEQRVQDMMQRISNLSLENQKIILDELDKIAQRSINMRMTLHDQILSGLTNKFWIKHVAEIERMSSH
jgi:hypothetical protein